MRWEEGMMGHPFIGLEGQRGGRATEGNGMVVEAAVSGGDQLGWWWGVMRRGALAILGAEGGAERRRTCMCM
jgi:hypothetical protein